MPEEIESEPHSDSFYHERNHYFYDKVLGKGGQGIVYLYKTKDKVPLKLAAKASLKNNRISKELISFESKDFKKISNILHAHHKLYAPKFFGETFFDDTFVIIMEFINQSIEEAIKDPNDPTTYTKAMLGMFDAIQSLH
jgi:hypothetical protein